MSTSRHRSQGSGVSAPALLDAPHKKRAPKAAEKHGYQNYSSSWQFHTKKGQGVRVYSGNGQISMAREHRIFILDERSTLTDRAQTTVPSAIRKVIGAEPGATLRWTVLDSGGVLVECEPPEHDDPAIAAFLALLEGDIKKGNVQAMPVDLLAEGRSLVDGVEVDLDAPLQ